MKAGLSVLVTTDEPFAVVVMRTARWRAGGTVAGCVKTPFAGVFTARWRATLVVAGCMTFDTLLLLVMPVASALASGVLTIGAMLPRVVVVDEDVVVPAARFALPMGGFAATSGDGIDAEEMVGFSDPAVRFETPAANCPTVAALAAVVKTGAAFTAAVVAAAVTPALVPGVAMTMTPASPAPPVMTGVAGELIEELTVTSGFAYIDGGITCPVGAV
jgi:hypothetical protein